MAGHWHGLLNMTEVTLMKMYFTATEKSSLSTDILLVKDTFMPVQMHLC